jgi:hypothetical protein
MGLNLKIRVNLGMAIQNRELNISKHLRDFGMSFTTFPLEGMAVVRFVAWSVSNGVLSGPSTLRF